MGTVPTKRAILRYSGIFDFDGLYAAVIDWAKNYNFMWHEVDYKHKVPNPLGAEQEWKWLLTKENRYLYSLFIYYLYFFHKFLFCLTLPNVRFCYITLLFRTLYGIL